VKRRLVRALSSVVAGLALAVLSREPLAPSLTLAFALASVLPWPRLPLDRATQRLAGIVIVLLTVVGLRASGMPMRGPHLGAFGYGFALAPLMVVALRLWVDGAEGGPRVDLSLGLVSLLATGGARPGIAYLAFVLAFLGAAVAAQRSEDPHRIPVARLSPRTRRVAWALLLTAAVFGVTASVVAHLAYQMVHRRMASASATAFEETAGLSDNVRLGSMAALLTSDTVVLRVSGPEVDRLRGVVLDEYGGGRWTRARIENLVPVDVPRARPRGANVVDVRPIHPDRDYVFLPFEARDVATPSGSLRADSMGVARSVSADPSSEVWFRIGERDAFRVGAARLEDLLMPHKLRAPLTAIASEWTREATTPQESLAAIEAHLRRDYTYTTEPQPRSSLDPVLAFLTVSRRGHCEYFASALALLARSIGIPTRMILGYRVGERNAYWSHYVVRTKNAHAWVEAYLPDGKWVTVDPTPMTELPQDQRHDEHGITAAFEAAAIAWEYVEDWLARRSVFELGAAAVLGVIVFAMQRWLRTRRPAVPERDDGLQFGPAPEAYLRLEAELERRGRGREPSEPLETWIARLEDPTLTPVLLRYIAARYGTSGTEGLDAALNDAVRGLARKTPRWK
jgi:transglutaminase-like putative cysteine protease